MKLIVAVILVSVSLLSISSAQDVIRDQKTQDPSREQKLVQIKDLNAQIAKIVEELASTPAADVHQAESEGLLAIRLNPRETYGWIAAPQGGGAYYSFSERSHDYQHTAQIELQQGYLSVGFAGADYGFMIDLGERPLAEVGGETPEAKFLLEYIAPSDEPVARAEYGKLQAYEAGGFLYKNRFPAIVGHAYLLRAITYSRSDLLVGIRVIRKESDGSLILYWKPLQSFNKPELRRQDTSN